MERERALAQRLKALNDLFQRRFLASRGHHRDPVAHCVQAFCQQLTVDSEARGAIGLVVQIQQTDVHSISEMIRSSLWLCFSMLKRWRQCS